MKIELHRIKIRDLVDGYVDDAESGFFTGALTRIRGKASKP